MAFTLVEMLLTVVLGGLLLVAASMFLFHVGQLSIHERNRPQLRQHADLVSNFIETMLQQATSPNANRAGDTPKKDINQALIEWRSLPGNSRSEPDHLSWLSAISSPFFADSDSPPVERRMFLKHESEKGLLLRWHRLQEENDPQRRQPKVKELVLSPRITAVTWFRFDREQERWETLSPKQITSAEKKIPDVLQLTFEWPEKQPITRILFLPANNATEIPLY